jgi:hypothetical protein
MLDEMHRTVKVVEVLERQEMRSGHKAFTAAARNGVAGHAYLMNSPIVGRRDVPEGLNIILQKFEKRVRRVRRYAIDR